MTAIIKALGQNNHLQIRIALCVLMILANRFVFVKTLRHNPKVYCNCFIQILDSAITYFKQG